LKTEMKACTVCQRTMSIRNFPIAVTKGKVYVRAWCKRCLRSYYARVWQRKKDRKAAAAAMSPIGA